MSTDRARGPVVVGVDAAGSSAAALDWATLEAGRDGRRLVVVHAFPPTGYAGGIPAGIPDEDLRGAAAGLLDEACAHAVDLVPTLEVTPELVVGNATRALLDACDDASLLVVGSHRRSEWGAILLGSVAHHVTAHAPVPVAVVRRPPADPSGPVVVGVDGSQAAELALGFGFDRAAALGVPLVVLHGWRETAPLGYGMTNVDPEMWAAFRTDAQLLLSEALAGWTEKYPQVSVRAMVVEAHPADALRDAASRAQLLVVGSHGHGAFTGMLLGSVSAELIHTTTTPMVVVRQAPSSAEVAR